MSAIGASDLNRKEKPDMNTLAAVLASIVLVPQPTRLVEGTGSYPTGAIVRAVADATVPAEGYRLSVRPDGIVIASSDAAGRFYAEQTLEQLRDGDAYSCVEIEDAPAFRWRGLMLDEGRRGLPLERVHLERA